MHVSVLECVLCLLFVWDLLRFCCHGNIWSVVDVLSASIVVVCSQA